MYSTRKCRHVEIMDVKNVTQKVVSRLGKQIQKGAEEALVVRTADCLMTNYSSAHMTNTNSRMSSEYLKKKKYRTREDSYVTALCERISNILKQILGDRAV
jgi:hypothetical protein